nr:hypothetical protein [Tanacetum cinerariifolium]
MSSLFADTHNVVAILEKSDAAEGFEKIIDFLSGSYIHYALTVNPYIYISCIKQFWNTASVKRSDDAEGVVCLPNEKIFAGLAQMGYEKPSTKLTFYKAFFSSQWKFLIHTILQYLSAKRTSWNEFSTTMASAVICLSKGQKFNFSKYIFDSLNQVGDLSTHTTRFISPALTQKVFANIRRVGKGFSGVETPLFEGMLAVRQPTKEGLGGEFPPQPQQVLYICYALSKRVENLENDNAAQKLVIIKMKARVKRLEKANMVKSSKLRRLRKVRASKQVESFDDMEDVFNQGRMIDDIDKDKGIELVKDAKVAKSEGRHAAQQVKKQAEIYHIDLDHSFRVLSMQEDDSEVQEVVEVVTTAKLITEVVSTDASQVSAASATIPAAKLSIPAAGSIVFAAYTRRRKGVIIRDPEEELSLKTPAETPKIELDAEYERKLHEEINRDEFNKDIDWDAAMDHVNQKYNNPQYIKRYQGMKKRPQTESEACKNMMIYLKNTAGYKMDFFKGMTYAQICPIFQARFDENMRFLFKSSEEMEKRLEVVDDEDDDVFIEPTPLARKVPVVDYQIVLVDNKPRFKIIKADETHQLYISFTTLLNNFNREDLENLWRIVKDSFSTSKPTNFSDEYLLLTLKTIFEEPDGQDAIWRNQKSVHSLALVKSWKLQTSCGVHVITLSTVQLFLLVERRYLLLRFTLEQLVNVTRLQVEEESKMSLKLLRFTRQQLQEYRQG